MQSLVSTIKGIIRHVLGSNENYHVNVWMNEIHIHRLTRFAWSYKYMQSADKIIIQFETMKTASYICR